MFYGPSYPWFRYMNNRYPTIDISTFQVSLQKSSNLIQSATNTVENLQASPDTMNRLMVAAQASQDDEVDAIMNEVTGPIKVETSYTPISVNFTFIDDQAPCCRLTLNLQWN
ncbi:hypothetical protein ACM26V_19435 [Salipaludibacillus sp. HK11]|uniref:hypothetical protein n=1 Tax=Salipaludibacillus sp. HK11 TaxID=3394320 RepID=UPI0039FCDE70